MILTPIFKILKSLEVTVLALALVAAVLSVANTRAQESEKAGKNWILLKNTCDFKLYFDLNSEATAGQYKGGLLLLDYRRPQKSTFVYETNGNFEKKSVSYASETYLVNLECKHKKEKVISDSYYSGNMGGGRLNYSVKPDTGVMDIPNASIEEELHKFLCLKMPVDVGPDCTRR